MLLQLIGSTYYYHGEYVAARNICFYYNEGGGGGGGEKERERERKREKATKAVIRDEELGTY